MGAAYSVVAWVILQLLDVVADPLHLPEFFFIATIVLLAVGFPVTLFLVWVLKVGEDNLELLAADAAEPVGTSTRNYAEIGLLAVLAIGMVWLIAKDLASEERDRPVGEVPIVVLMDTYAPRGVYDDDTVSRNGTNADVLSVELAGLPVILQKEAIGAVWNRENQIIKLKPAFIVIHRSAFFHSMNNELNFGYPDQPEVYAEEKWDRLYDIADNKLIAFLGYVAVSLPQTRFLIYSRGTGGGWTENEYRDKWVLRAENRFDSLVGRISTIAMPGGVATGSFRNPLASALVRDFIMEESSLVAK